MQRFIPLILLVMSGCANTTPASDRKPSAATVARIERKLLKDPCIATLAGLKRTYAYPWRSGAVDDRTVFVTLQTSNAAPDVVRMAPNREVAHTEPSRGWGIYDVRNDRLTVADCASAA